MPSPQVTTGGVQALVLMVQDPVHDKFPPGNVPPVSSEHVLGGEPKLPPSQVSPRIVSIVPLPHGLEFGVQVTSEHAAGHEPLSGPLSQVSGAWMLVSPHDGGTDAITLTSSEHDPEPAALKQVRANVYNDCGGLLSVAV